MRIDRRSNLDLRQIEAFVALVERGTTSAAAEHLRLSQSAVWNSVRDFEAQLDRPLFRRKGRRLEPTDEAQMVYDDILPLLGVMNDLAGRLRALKHRQRGRLAIAATPPVGHSILPLALNQLLGNRPGLLPDLIVRHPREVLRAVELGQVDLGLMLGLVENPGLHSHVLGETELVAVVPRDHVLTTRAVVGPADLVKSPFIGVGPVLGPLVEGAFAMQGIRYKPQLRCDQAQSACALVHAALGVTVVDSYSAAMNAGLAIVTRRFAPATRAHAVALLRPDAQPDETITELLAGLASAAAALGPVGWG